MTRFLVLLCCTFVTLVAASCVKLPRRAQPPSQNAPPLALDATHSPPPRVNINTATPDQLEKLPGIGTTLAARIVEHRAHYGAFRRVEHLLLVRGISERRFREMRALVTVE
ncbi:MAG TPA: helix-hairpin-helix domain-containing protein [Pyrinomonadaceae bacterium]|jgi:competence protein ComEA